MQSTDEVSLPVALLTTVDSLIIVVSGSPPVTLMHTVTNPSDSATTIAVSKISIIATEWEGIKKLILIFQAG